MNILERGHCLIWIEPGMQPNVVFASLTGLLPHVR
jgi:hypothetical protein